MEVPRHARVRRFSRRTAVMLLATGAIGLGLGACSGDNADDKGTTPLPTGPSGYMAALLAPPKEKPHIVLPDTSGRQFDLQKETEGYLTLLFVGYTNCPDVCPVHMARVSSALKKMPPGEAAKVKVVFITADPARDTPTVLRQWLDYFDPSFIGLIPSPAQLNEVTTVLSMNPIEKHDLGNGNYSVDHAAFLLAFGADDNMARLGFLGLMPQEIYDHDIPKLVADTVKG